MSELFKTSTYIAKKTQEMIDSKQYKSDICEPIPHKEYDELYENINRNYYIMQDKNNER